MKDKLDKKNKYLIFLISFIFSVITFSSAIGFLYIPSPNIILQFFYTLVFLPFYILMPIGFLTQGDSGIALGIGILMELASPVFGFIFWFIIFYFSAKFIKKFFKTNNIFIINILPIILLIITLSIIVFYWQDIIGYHDDPYKYLSTHQ